jgi:hypothetical protein
MYFNIETKQRLKCAPQTYQVLRLLKSKGSTTQLEAGGVLRVRSLTKRISELRALGCSISSEFKRDHTGQRYARYHFKDNKASKTLLETFKHYGETA